MEDSSAEASAVQPDQQSIADEQQTASPSSPKEKATRIYRACVHCRQRKSKCQLDAGARPGLPPCRRCVREGRECVLAGSRRGGRRPKKNHSLDSLPMPLNGRAESVATTGFGADAVHLGGAATDATWDETWDGTKSRRMSITQFVSGAQGDSVESTIDKADIQNPSDALEILAQVAGGEHSNSGSAPARSVPTNRENGDGQAHGMFSDFPPFVNGTITYQDIIGLFDRYHQKFHQFFPIVPVRWFEPANLSHMSSTEPHLFAAILTVAAADTNVPVYRACSIHVRGLIAELIYGGDGDVEAVEALLVLSEWATIWQPSTARNSKVLEDRYAWMLVGMAVRLGVYLGLEQTSFRSGEAKELSPQHARRRLVWAACYMADRQVSIRVGKGFWSRGPGPTSFFEPKDFPSLERKRPDDPDYASIFKANLELIHIFSNAHDVLYSNRAHGMRLILSGGAYVKYIDDFRTAIRGWHSRYMHHNYDYPANIRSTLLLLHDYLRLYVNAFAFQASFPRFGSLERDGNSVASLPDARFIYEAVDAAKSLLMTVNKFVDPQNCLRFLPLRYYTYIVYSTVFLYKALATMSRQERESVRSMVNDTVICLTKSSTDSGHLGTRYAKLISLLWRRPPKQPNRPAPENQNFDAPEEIDYIYPANQKPLEGDLSLNAFSWLDLSAVGDFATRNANTTQGYPEFDFTDMNQSYLDGFAEHQQWYDNGSSGITF